MNAMNNPPAPRRNQAVGRFLVWLALFSAAHYTIVMVLCASLLDEQHNSFVPFTLFLCLKILSLPIGLLNYFLFYQQLNPAYLTIFWILNSILWGFVLSALFEWMRRRREIH
jgi:hypothetical protein